MGFLQYTPPYRDRGRIKSWNERFIYVVFRCGGHWDDFIDYDAALTLPEYLEFEAIAENVSADSGGGDGRGV